MEIVLIAATALQQTFKYEIVLGLFIYIYTYSKT